MPFKWDILLWFKLFILIERSFQTIRLLLSQLFTGMVIHPKITIGMMSHWAMHILGGRMLTVIEDIFREYGNIVAIVNGPGITKPMGL